MLLSTPPRLGQIANSADTAETEITREWLGVLSLMPRYDAVQTDEKEAEEE